MTMTTERIRCPSCSQLIPVPVGPDLWEAAPDPGWIKPAEPLTCPHCTTDIRMVWLAWLVPVRERMRQLASWGAVLCTKRGQEPTHEDLDQVEQFMAFLKVQKAAAG
jgi:hypothetical protein